MYTNKILPHKNFEHNNSNKKLVSFRAYEKTFMIIKPDAYERNLNTIIENNILASGLKISKSFEGIASKNKMRKNYISKQNKSFFEDWIKFLTSGKLKAIVVEGDNAISKALNLKKEIRTKYAPNEKRYNLVHCSDDEINAKREIKNFFDMEI